MFGAQGYSLRGLRRAPPKGRTPWSHRLSEELIIDGKRRSLLVNTVYAVGGTGFYHVCQLGVLVLLAKYASPEIQGQYLLSLAIATPVVLFFELQLRSALVADTAHQFSLGTYYALRSTMLVPAALVLAACLTWATLTTSTTTAGGAPAATEPSIAYLIILGGMFAVRIAWSVAEVGWGTYQRRERLDLLAASYGLRGLASIVPFAILLPLFYVRFRQNAPLRLADGTAAAVLLCVVGFVVVYYAFDRPRVLDRKLGDLSWDWRSVRSLAWQTLPLGLVALTINLCDSIPRFLIDGQPNGKAQLGYFGSLAYVTLAGNLVIIQAATAAANRLSLYYQRDLRAFLWLAMRLAGLALGVGVVVMAAALLAGEWILRVLYRPDYAQFVIEFQIIVFAHCIALLTNILGAATTQMRLFWVQVPVQIVTLVCTVVAAVLLIPGDTPVRGAAYTALVRAAVQLVLYGACIGLGLGWRRRILTKTEPGR